MHTNDEGKTKWQGKSKGTVLGYLCCLYTINICGILLLFI